MLFTLCYQINFEMPCQCCRLNSNLKMKMLTWKQSGVSGKGEMIDKDWFPCVAYSQNYQQPSGDQNILVWKSCWQNQFVLPSLQDKVNLPLSDCSLHLLTCYYNKDSSSLATLPPGSPYLPAENADFTSEVKAGQRAMGRKGDQWSRNLMAATRDSRVPKNPGNVLTMARGFFAFLWRQELR